MFSILTSAIIIIGLLAGLLLITKPPAGLWTWLAAIAFIGGNLAYIAFMTITILEQYQLLPELWIIVALPLISFIASGAPILALQLYKHNRDWRDTLTLEKDLDKRFG